MSLTSLQYSEMFTVQYTDRTIESVSASIRLAHLYSALMECSVNSWNRCGCNYGRM